MTNREIMDLFKGFDELEECKLPAKVAFAITRNSRKLQPIVEDFNAARLNILINHGAVEVPDKPGYYQLQEENPAIVEQINDEIGDILNMNNPDVQLVKIKLSDIALLSLSLAQMDALYPMIEEEEG